MSGANLTINGGFNAHTGLVSIPSALGSTLNGLLQQYLDGVSSSIVGGTIGFENNDIAANQDFTAGLSSVPGLEEITDIDNAGASASGGNNGTFFASNYAKTLYVQAPDNMTVTANSVTSTAIFGENSNVDYIDSTASPASIYAAGGNDTISLLLGSRQSDDTIVAAGSSLVNLFNTGSDAVTLTGNDTAYIQEADATITATGNASVGLWWYSQNSGGTLDFINRSNNAATVFSSVFNGVQAATHVTVDGGAGGGYYNAGTGGNSSLFGGTGIVTLVGAANGDTLTATGYTTSNLTGNALFAGSGTELLTATSTTGNNLFEVGLNYPGLSTPPDGNGTISSSGSGAQNYFVGNSEGETIIGSTAATSNTYHIISDPSVGATGGSTFVIENFSANSYLLFQNAEETGLGDASVTSIMDDPAYSNSALVVLSDHTEIHLIGVSASSLSTHTEANGTQFITS